MEHVTLSISAAGAPAGLQLPEIAYELGYVAEDGPQWNVPLPDAWQVRFLRTCRWRQSTTRPRSRSRHRPRGHDDHTTAPMSNHHPSQKRS